MLAAVQVKLDFIWFLAAAELRGKVGWNETQLAMVSSIASCQKLAMD